MDPSSSPPRTAASASPTASPKGRTSKYASEEEKKAAQRERKRLWAQKKRAELKRLAQEATAQGDSSSTTSSPAVQAPQKPIAYTSGAEIPHKSQFEQAPVESKAEISRPEYDNRPASFIDYDTVPLFPPSYPPTDKFLVPPPPTPHSQLHDRDFPKTDEVLVIFLPGNPGLISYYETYLNELSSQLAWSDTDIRYDILGISHAGFHVKRPEEGQTNEPEGKLYSLREQISLKVDLVEWLWKIKPGLKIVLMGHSVGAYILLETLRILNERKVSGSPQNGEIVGGVLLFPTITHIASSPRGKWATSFLKLGVLANILQFWARLWTLILPTFLLTLLLRIFLPGFSREGLNATVQFLKSPSGVKQSAKMARDEMLEILDDDWTDELWGVTANAHHSGKRPAHLPSPSQNCELIFYYAAKDPWVSPAERDDIINRRARGGSTWIEGSADEIKSQVLNGKEATVYATNNDRKPKMFVCEDGVRHSFSIRSSELMARKSSQWIEELVDRRLSQ